MGLRVSGAEWPPISAAEYLERRAADPSYPVTDTYDAWIFLTVDGAEYLEGSMGFVEYVALQFGIAAGRLRECRDALVRYLGDEIHSPFLWLRPRGADGLRVSLLDLHGTEFVSCTIPERDLEGVLRYIAAHEAALTETARRHDRWFDVEIGPLADAIAAMEQIADEGRRVIEDEERHERAQVEPSEEEDGRSA